MLELLQPLSINNLFIVYFFGFFFNPMLHILTPHKYIVGDWILLPCITTFYSYSIMAVSLMIYCMIVPDIVRSFYMSTVETNKRLFIIIIIIIINL